MATVPHPDGELQELDRIRMSLDLTPAMKAIIDDLARQEGATRSEVLRRANRTAEGDQGRSEEGRVPRAGRPRRQCHRPNRRDLSASKYPERASPPQNQHWLSALSISGR